MGEGVVVQCLLSLYCAADTSDVTKYALSWVVGHCDAKIWYFVFYHFPHIHYDVMFSSPYGIHVEVFSSFSII